MKAFPLRAKLTLWSALIVASALLASALASDIFVYRTERRELDRELQQAADHYFEQDREELGSARRFDRHEVEEVFSPHDENRFVMIKDAEGRVVYRSPNMPAVVQMPSRLGLHDSHIGETAVRLGVFRERDLKLYVAGSTAEFTVLITELVIGHLVALPFVLALVALGGWWLARQALRPIQAMADAAAAIQPEQLERRLPVFAQADEIGRLARVFNQLLDRLQRGFQQATRFSTDASHELRTPLAVLRGSIEEMLADPALSDAQREAVAELQLQTQHLISITSTLLLLARADAGRLHLQLEDADLRDIIAECLDDARILGEQRDVRIDSEIGEAAPVRVDAVRVRQMVLNILDNAVKYNVPGGSVTLRLEPAEGAWRISVQNTGPEISATESEGLFTRFFRAGQQEDTPGSGLGLSLARELARTHGGDVFFVGRRDGWNEFELRLPARAAVVELSA